MYMSLVISYWSTISLCGFTFFACKSTVEVEVLLAEASCTIIQIMEQINFEQSLKNIPVPDDKSYHELFIVAMEKTIKAFRNKAAIFVSKNKKANTTKDTFGIPSLHNPEAVPELKNFENDFINLAQNIQFRKFNNNLQKNLKRICDDIRNDPKLIIPADKTYNFYKLTPKEHQELRQKDVQNCYKKEKKVALEKVKKEHQKIAKKLDIQDRLFRTSEQECFIKLKDHKSNFRENPTVRTLNPAKPSIR